MPLQEQPAYLQHLRSLAQFSTVPASIADLFRWAPANVSRHVQSQTTLLLPLNGKTVTPPRHDLSPLTKGAQTHWEQFGEKLAGKQGLVNTVLHWTHTLRAGAGAGRMSRSSQTPSVWTPMYCCVYKTLPASQLLAKLLSVSGHPNTGGFRTDDRTAFWSALLIKSFIVECLLKQPALYFQEKPCKPPLFILPLQLQKWRMQTSVLPLRQWQP